MCVIIDACVRDRVFSSPPHPDAVPVREWIERRGGRVAYGGKILCDELFQSERARRQIRVWKQAGLASEFPQIAIDAETARVRAGGVVRSNDSHVVALARVSGARTLYSTDVNLHIDFKNTQLVADPGGKIYQGAHHRNLLEHTSSCRVGRSRLTQDLWTPRDPL